MEFLEKKLASLRVQAKSLHEVEVAEVQQKWLHRHLGESISKPKFPFFWEAFLQEKVPHISGDGARNAYRSAEYLEYYVISAFSGGPGYLCNSSQLPNLEGKNVDVLVLPPDLSWTMAFNHEGYGPFFTRLEWALSGKVDSGQ